MSLWIAMMLTAVASPDEQVGSAATVKERQALHSYGQCLVQERAGEARSLLAMDYRDKKYGRAMTKLVNSRVTCPGVDVPRGAYRAGGLLWAGTFADWLLRRDRALNDLAARTAYKPELPTIEARNAGEYMAFCVVRANPAGTAAVLRTDPASKEELQALKAIGPTLSACVPANSKSEFTRESLRALLALGAWRLAMHNSGAAPSRQEAAR